MLLLKSDDSVTFDWFVTKRYLPMRSGQWRPATKDKTEYEIKKYAADTDKRDGGDQLAYSGNFRKPEADSEGKLKCNGPQLENEVSASA